MSARAKRIASWLIVSLALHALCMVGMTAGVPPAEASLFELPDSVEFGLVDQAPGPEGAPAPPPAPVAAAPVAKPKLRAARVPHVPAVAEASVPVIADAGAPAQARGEPEESSEAAAVSGLGLFPGGAGDGSGTQGDGTGGVRGAILALNVDLGRVKDSALLLETQALLDIIPEWQALLAGSGVEPLRDFRRVFVAAPSADRASLVVSAQHALTRARVAQAVSSLAAERGTPAPFQDQAGIAVAAWRNRGPTERVVALTAPDQLLIARPSDLERVLSVARTLGEARKRQGFTAEEIEARGGLLAMQPEEAVALWIEGLSRYVPSASLASRRAAPASEDDSEESRPSGASLSAVPESVRLSIFRVDQFHTDLRVTGNYGSQRAAAAARDSMEALRRQLSEHPRVIFLGLKSALDAAQIEPVGNTLRLSVRLTLHQTRYLMALVRRALQPRVTH
ncbi:MAG TPA: hypothetical protein VJR89_09230 [Polyangiales bacterium]|nr:hypothetical protein [Polyangiales bacterium]